MNYKADIAIAFDLDDTLYDERDYCRACIECVARQLAPIYGCSEASLADAMMQGNPYDGLRDSDLAPGLAVETFLSLYRSAEPDTLPLRPDARRLLDHLRQHRQEVPLYLITDGRLHGQRAKINALGLHDYFEPSHIIISEAIGADKTTPLPFATAMVRENRWHGWVYIGDNQAKDFRWPRALEWHTVQVRDHGTNTHPQKAVDRLDVAFRPEQIIDSLDEITSSL